MSCVHPWRSPPAEHGPEPIVLERAEKVGGIARTETYKGYCFDFGGHRFFTKNEEIQNLWKWIYVHSASVRVGRIQNFKNWSAAMVPRAETTSLGMEYFCDEGDEIWQMPDEDLRELASAELAAEEKLFSGVLWLNAKVFGLTLGILCGLSMFIAANGQVIKGGDRVGPHLALLSQYFIGYRVSFLGSFIGFFYGFAVGTLSGSFVG